MLFPYQYVPHTMEKLQGFIDFIFHEVWCQAPGGKPFGLELFEGHVELHEAMSAFFYGDTKAGDFFYGGVERIYGHFAALSPEQIAQFRHWYEANNDIEKICANDPALEIIRYADVQKVHPALSEQLGGFFKQLYSNMDAAPLKKRIGDIDNHYRAFMAVNNKTGKCPFCGISDMHGVYHSAREAYDHYFPKGLYPFNSINFRNLVPACHHCNSSYKNSKDPAHTPKDPAGVFHRRKVFYPYALRAQRLELTIHVAKPNIDQLTPGDIDIAFGPPELTEQIDTWKDVYGIEERYRAKLLDGDGKAWLEEVLDEWRWKEESAGQEGRSPDEYLRDLNRHADKSPFTNANFLKMAFLDSYRHAGLFDRQTKAVEKVAFTG